VLSQNGTQLATSTGKTVCVVAGGTVSGGHGSTTKPKQLASNTFFFWVNYRFTIGSHSYYWLWPTCSEDSEATDGMGRPGSHGCGTKRISSHVNYLG
jgi:hypothetical protein